MPFQNPLESTPAVLADGTIIGVTNAPGSTGLLTACEESLLATGTAVQSSLIVALPTNCQALRVFVPGGTSLVQVIGQTTGFAYGPILPPAHGAVYACEVDPAADASVQLLLSGAPGASWYVVATLATEIVGSVGIEVSGIGTFSQFGAMQGLATGLASWAQATGDTQGKQFVVAATPGRGSSDHPPTEVQTKFGLLSASNGSWLAAPGAGQRYRLFSLTVAVQTGSAGGAAELTFTDWSGNPSGVRVAVGAALSDTLPLPEQGIPVATNGAVPFTVAGTISAIARAVWTVETA